MSSDLRAWGLLRTPGHPGRELHVVGNGVMGPGRQAPGLAWHPQAGGLVSFGTLLLIGHRHWEQMVRAERLGAWAGKQECAGKWDVLAYNSGTWNWT